MSATGKDLLEGKLEACRKLSLHVAHKIRNPLSALLNVLFQLKKKLPEDETNRELLVILEEEIWNLKVLSDELALFSKNLPEERGDTDLGAFLTGFRERCITDCVLFSDEIIDIDPSSKGLHAEFDQACAGVVLEALLFHALIKTDERPRVRLSAAVEDGHVVFTAAFAGACHLNIQPGGLKRIVTSGEDRVVADLSMALLEHLVGTRGGRIDVSEAGPASTSITLTL